MRYGIREFGMSAAMNGIALHGGFIPYGGTFFVFSDYARGAIRLSALMGLRVIYVLTHDSIGLGEDGPTHQPVEHFAMLRATPNLHVFRPCDAVETAECWELALASQRHALGAAAVAPEPADPAHVERRKLSARGAYVLSDDDGERDVTLLRDRLGSRARHGGGQGAPRQGHKRVAVVSMPSWDLFEAQPAEYRAEVLGAAPRIADRGRRAARLGPLDRRARRLHRHERIRRERAGRELYRHFGITADAIVAAANALTA